MNQLTLFGLFLGASECAEHLDRVGVLLGCLLAQHHLAGMTILIAKSRQGNCASQGCPCVRSAGWKIGYMQTHLARRCLAPLLPHSPRQCSTRSSFCQRGLHAHKHRSWGKGPLPGSAQRCRDQALPPQPSRFPPAILLSIVLANRGSTRPSERVPARSESTRGTERRTFRRPHAKGQERRALLRPS